MAFDPSHGHDFYAKSMRILLDESIPFVVGGAFALRAHAGIERDTKDFDIMMLPGDVERALAAFRRAGFRAEITFSHWLAKAHRGEFFIDIIFSSGNGVCPVDEEWIEHGRVESVFGQEVRLCPPEEMIWQKCYIMERERFDGADVAHLLRSRAEEMDWPRLLRRFGGDGRVLLAHLILFGFIYPAKRDLIPRGVMEKLLAGLEEDRTEHRLCNGTLLSRAQYLADIERWGLADARLERPGVMTPAELEAWTSAIEVQVFRH